jgi:predicted protein tyrosine phosphatase
LLGERSPQTVSGKQFPHKLAPAAEAETIFQGVDGHEVRSAGTEENARIKVTEGHIGWADLIFAMEKKHVRRLQGKFSNALAGKKVICLHIPDEFEYMNEDLIGLLQSQCSRLY